MLGNDDFILIRFVSCFLLKWHTVRTCTCTLLGINYTDISSNDNVYEDFDHSNFFLYRETYISTGNGCYIYMYTCFALKSN